MATRRTAPAKKVLFGILNNNDGELVNSQLYTTRLDAERQARIYSEINPECFEDENCYLIQVVARIKLLTGLEFKEGLE